MVSYTALIGFFATTLCLILAAVAGIQLVRTDEYAVKRQVLGVLVGFFLVMALLCGTMLPDALNKLVHGY